MWANRVPYKDFARHSQDVSARLEEASLRQARQLGREVRYLNSAQLRKEDVAREIAARDGITAGPICVLRSVDPCYAFAIHKNRQRRRLEIQYRQRKCLHLYHYQVHPAFGFLHARIQTWFPFHVYVCLNGREWLARQMDQAGLSYRRYDNGFTWVADLPRAQALLDAQLQAHWPSLLGELAAALNPLHAEFFARYPTQYYWSVAQSEWASDVLFRSRADLQAVYPRLVRHALTTYGAVDVLRFLGRKIPAGGGVPPGFSGAVESDLKERPEGVRLKHWLNHNSIKVYDKGSVLRVECTLNDPKDFRVYRPREGDADGPKAWRPLRYGVADYQRRAAVGQGATERYLEALAAVRDTTPVRALAEPLCRLAAEPRPARATPAPAAAATAGPAAPAGEAVAGPGSAAAAPVAAAGAPAPRRVRALNPLAAEDGALLEAVSRPEFVINGLRNRDLRGLLYPRAARDKAEERRRSAAVGRKLRLLRGHGLLHKVPRTHRYLVSAEGRKALTALLAARDANADFLTTHAA